MRDVDTLLISVGGNDMGFAGVIAWGLVPVSNRQFLIIREFANFFIALGRKEANVICPYDGAPNGKGLFGVNRPCETPTAESRIRDLPARYLALEIALRETAGLTGAKILLAQYPNPLQDSEGKVCGERPGQERPNPWSALQVEIPLEFNQNRDWQINLTTSEARQVNARVIPNLNATIASCAVSRKCVATNKIAATPECSSPSAAGERCWRTVDMGQAMSRAGWCTGRDVQKSAPHVEFEPMSPATAMKWNAFSDNVRRIRTANDSLFTQWPGREDRRDGLSGTFHPNVQGYAASAAAVITELERTK